MVLEPHQKVEVLPVHVEDVIDRFGMFVEMSTSGDVCCPDGWENGDLSESNKLYWFTIKWQDNKVMLVIWVSWMWKMMCT